MPLSKRDTNQVLFVEMNCSDQQWTEKGCATMEHSGKLLFRRLNPSPVVPRLNQTPSSRRRIPSCADKMKSPHSIVTSYNSNHLQAIATDDIPDSL